MLQPRPGGLGPSRTPGYLLNRCSVSATFVVSLFHVYFRYILCMNFILFISIFYSAHHKEYFLFISQ